MVDCRASVCPDCPSAYAGLLGNLVDPRGGRCAFRCVSLASRQPIPPRWFGTFGLAVVRRGLLVRQRVDAYGAATAIDALGPGAAAPLSEGGEVSAGGYAADDALICLCPRRSLRAAVESAAPTASDVIALHASALERIERMAESRGRSTALARVASLLCALADTLSPPRHLDLIPATLQQRDLAALLAMRHESVCRALGTLERRKALLRGDDGIRILDRAMLESA